MALQAGQYDIDDLVSKLPFSKRTIERKLPEWDIMVKRDGNKRIFVLTDENAKRINDIIANHEKWHKDVIVNGNANNAIYDERLENDALREKLHQKEILIAELTGHLEKSEALSDAERRANQALLGAKQSEIETLKMSLSAMEKTTQSLQASMMLLERDNQRMSEQLTPSIPMITANQKPKTFLERLRFVFDVG